MPGPHKVLLVDDDEQLILLVKARLELKGYQVLTTCDGCQVVDLIAQQHPDLVVLDIFMPTMDGYSCLREINRHFGRGRIKIMVLTAHDRMKDLFEQEHVAGYVMKPIDYGELLVRIEQMLTDG